MPDNNDLYMVSQNSSIDPQYINELCDDLQAILHKELQAGNLIRETWKGDWPRPDGKLFILLDNFFLSPHSPPIWVKYHPLDDPHFAGAEYWCEKHCHSLFCGFDPLMRNTRRE